MAETTLSSDFTCGPELREPPYKSSCWLDVPLRAPWPLWFDGGLCDRLGCLDATETPTSRFCEPHRRAHGERLQAQLREIVQPNGRQSA